MIILHTLWWIYLLLMILYTRLAWWIKIDIVSGHWYGRNTGINYQNQHNSYSVGLWYIYFLFMIHRVYTPVSWGLIKLLPSDNQTDEHFRGRTATPCLIGVQYHRYCDTITIFFLPISVVFCFTSRVRRGSSGLFYLCVCDSHDWFTNWCFQTRNSLSCPLISSMPQLQHLNLFFGHTGHDVFAFLSHWS